MRYIFVHHVREFPFLDKAKEEEFWQDKLQVVRTTLLQLMGAEMLTDDIRIVPRVLCKETYFLLRRQTGRNEEKEAIHKMSENGGVDDGFGDTNRFWI